MIDVDDVDHHDDDDDGDNLDNNNNNNNIIMLYMMMMIFILIGIKLAAEFINSQSKQLGEVDPLRLALQSKAHRDVIHVIDENGITIGLKKNPFYSSSNGSINNVDNYSNGNGVGGTNSGSNSGVVIDFDNNDLDGSRKDNGLKIKTVRIDRDVDDDHGDDIEDLMAIDDDGGFISSESMSSSSNKMNNNDKIRNNRSKSQVRGRDDGVVRKGGGSKVETTTAAAAAVTVDFDSNGSSDAASDVDLISSHSNDSPPPPPSSSFSPLMTRDLELSLSSVPLSLLPIVPTLSIPSSSSSSSSSIPMTKNPMLNNKTITSILSMRDHYNNDDDIIDGFYDNLNRDNNYNSNNEVQREKKLFKSHYQHDVENLQLLMSQMTNQSSSSSLHHKNINPIRWIKDKASSALVRKQQHHHHQQHQDNTTKTQRRKSFSGGDIGQYDDDDDDDDDGGGGGSSSGIGAKGNTKISSDSSGNRATRNKYTTRATTFINPDRTATVIGREKTNGGGVDMDINNITIPAAKGSVRSNSIVNNQL